MNTQAPATNTQIVFSDIELALQAASTTLPTILSALAAFYPPAAAILKFMPLLQVALQGVNIVAQDHSQGAVTAHDANAAVISTLTPGAPGAPALQ